MVVNAHLFICGNVPSNNNCNANIDVDLPSYKEPNILKRALFAFSLQAINCIRVWSVVFPAPKTALFSP